MNAKIPKSGIVISEQLWQIRFQVFQRLLFIELKSSQNLLNAVGYLKIFCEVSRDFDGTTRIKLNFKLKES